jgi:hypothetical protein
MSPQLCMFELGGYMLARPVPSRCGASVGRKRGRHETGCRGWPTPWRGFWGATIQIFTGVKIRKSLFRLRDASEITAATVGRQSVAAATAATWKCVVEGVSESTTHIRAQA